MAAERFNDVYQFVDVMDDRDFRLTYRDDIRLCTLKDGDGHTKYIARILTPHEDCRTTYEREVYIAERSLGHPHIMQLQAKFSNEFEVITVYECPVHLSVNQMKAHVKGGLPIDVIRRIIKHTALALSHLHNHCSIIHNKVHLGNIFCFDAPDQPGGRIYKLGNFGHRANIGQQYVAPEKARLDHHLNTMFGGGGYTDSVDIWALGVATHELIFGISPFRLRCNYCRVPPFFCTRCCARMKRYMWSSSLIRYLDKNPRRFIKATLKVVHWRRKDIGRLLNYPFLADI